LDSTTLRSALGEENKKFFVKRTTRRKKPIDAGMPNKNGKKASPAKYFFDRAGRKTDKMT